MKDQASHQKGCSGHPVAVSLRELSERRKDAQACGCMKRFRSLQRPETQGLSPTLLERVTRKQGTDSMAWEYWRVQDTGVAVISTRAESLHVLDLLVLLLANCTYLSQKPLIHMQVI